MKKNDIVPEDAGAPGKDATLKTTTPLEEKAKAVAEAERIRELRERLYARGTKQAPTIRHELPKHEIHDTMEAPKGRSLSTEEKVTPVEVIASPVLVERERTTPVSSPDAVVYGESMGISARRKMLRKKVALIGVIFFVLATGIASLLMFSGNNTISGDNISLNASGPITVGGGEELPFQVSIANQNAVPIQSATLIIEYPQGTHSAENPTKEISIERKQLDSIEKGELVTIEMKARIFGEENEEKEIKISIDYRVSGSNATFHKEATPLRFKVSTSPIVMTFDSVKSISSGQEITLNLTVQSNSPTPLSDILVKTAYPQGFDFSKSTPETLSGEDTWKIALLKPGEKKVITVKGLMTGFDSETRNFGATAGVADASDKNRLASTLATARTEVKFEQPFLFVKLITNGSPSESVIINTHQTANVEVEFTNKLDTAVYDGKVFVELQGNALDEFEVKVPHGFYDSTKNTITWDSVDEESLKEILPGHSSTLTFSLSPKESIGRAPEVKMNVTVRGQRVFENKAPQELVGTVQGTIKVESVPSIASSVLYKDGPFTNTGPVPPIAERVTQYTYSLSVKADTNDVTGAELTAVLPQYVSWLDLSTDKSKVTYNPATRTMRWSIGDMEARSTKEIFVQVSILPSLSQAGITPTLLEAQRFKATDRFTGTVIRAEAPALTTSLSHEGNKDLEDGRVRTSD